MGGQDGYSEIADGALPKYNSLTQKLSEGLKLGILTDTKWCTYSSTSGLVCNSDKPSGGEGGGIDLEDIYTGEIADGALPKYNSDTNTLSEGLKLGTLSNTKMCVYSSSDGLVCNSDIPSAGIALSDVYSDAITDGALPKYNSLTQKLSEGLKLGTLTSGKWCTYTTEYGLVCNSDTPSGGGIAVEDIYEGTIADGDLTAYDNTSGKLKSAGAAVAYTPPETNAPLCGAESSGVGACTNLTDAAIPAAYTDIVGMWASGSCTGYLKSDGTCDAPQGGGNGIEYTPPEDPAPLCSDITGAIVACVNLKDEDLAEIEGSPDDLGVKIVTISEDPEAVIECEGKDRTYIVDVEADLIFQLPADPSGRRFCFGNNTYGKVISIVPDGTDTIRHAGDVTDSEGDNGLVSTGDESEFICLLGLSSSKWRTISYLGTWTIDEVELPSDGNGNGECVCTDVNNTCSPGGHGAGQAWCYYAERRQMAFQITAGKTGKACKISIAMNKEGNITGGAEISVCIHEDDDPGVGTSLGCSTTTLAADDLTADMVEYDFEGLDVDLTATSTYYVVVKSSAQCGNDLARIRMANADNTGCDTYPNSYQYWGDVDGEFALQGNTFALQYTLYSCE